MKELVKEFFLRGLICGGFGPIVYAIVMFILCLSNVCDSIDGVSLFKGVISIYIMAFLIAGFSVIWKVEKIGLAISIPIHGGVVYLSYLITYLINGWLSTKVIDWLVFTGIFILGYAFIWLIIYAVEKNRAKKLNMELKK